MVLEVRLVITFREGAITGRGRWGVHLGVLVISYLLIWVMFHLIKMY